MPANSADGAIARQWEMLKIIPSARSPGMKPSEFQNELNERGYEVSLRTVQRDLKALAEVFDIDCEDGEKNETLWRWQSGAKLDIQSLELTDALTLRLIETSLRPLLPASVLKALEPRLQNAADKLDAVNSRNAVSGWANKVASVLPMVPFIPPKIDAAVLDTVQDCLLKDFVITCRYRSVAAEKPKELKLHPLGLVQRGPVTYLIATAFHYEEPRPFALHRMSAVQNTYETVKRPKGFSLKQFIDDGGMGFGEATPINLVARISPMLARELEETKLSANQKIRADGDWFRIEATVQDTWQLRWWLLSKAVDLTILEPAELRSIILEHLEAALEAYRTEA
jgi:predicted DNA-binding transcriptional regulator YafY